MGPMQRNNNKMAVVEELLHAHPEANRSECERFWICFGKKHASRRLGQYLAWRKENCTADILSSTTREDADMWEMAASHAVTTLSQQQQQQQNNSNSNKKEANRWWDNSTTLLNSTLEYGEQDDDDDDDDNEEEIVFVATEEERKAAEELMKSATSGRQQNPASSPNDDAMIMTLPKEVDDMTPTLMATRPQRFVSIPINHETGECLRDLQGNRVIHALPAQIEARPDPKLYALTIGLYLEQVFCCCSSRHDSSMEKLTLLLDVRPGHGWPNVPIRQMVGLIKYVVNHMHALHPHRLSQCILYPVPRAAVALYKVAIQPFLDAQLRQRVVLLSGNGANLKAPVPLEKLSAYVSRDVVIRLEHNRLAAFKKRTSTTTSVSTTAAAASLSSPASTKSLSSSGSTTTETTTASSSNKSAARKAAAPPKVDEQPPKPKGVVPGASSFARAMKSFVAIKSRG